MLIMFYHGVENSVLLIKEEKSFMKKLLSVFSITFVSLGLLAACDGDIEDPVEDPAVDDPAVDEDVDEGL